MMNLAKADLYRIFKGVGIYIALAFVILWSVTSVVLKEPGNIQYYDTNIEDVLGNTDLESGKKLLVRSIMASNANLYYPLIIVVFVILMSDFSSKTIKNTLTSVASKKKYFAYKMSMPLALSVIILIFANVFTYVLNYIVNGKEYTESFVNILKVTCLQTVPLLGITSFLLFIGFLTKRAAIYNSITIPFIVLFQVAISYIALMTKSDMLIKFINNFELHAMFNKLAYLPKAGYCVECICFGIGEIIIFSLLGWIVFKKSEIK